jgi:3-hydroxyacyl-[acyl-carrier-protein] dehydratase
MLNTQEIQAIIPHRYPFLLVDRIVDLQEGVSAVGIKAVTANEPFFQGHFPGFSVMPGVLIVEALAQVGAVVLLRMPENQGKVALFAGIDGFRFRRQVTPGDTLRLEVQLTKMRGPVGKGAARATVEGKVVAEGELMFAVGPSTAEQVQRQTGESAAREGAGREGGRP